MKKTTRQFINLLLEKEEKAEKEKEEKAEKKPSASRVYDVKTSNKISQGRPIGDAGLAEVNHRVASSVEDAKAFLKDLGIQKPSGADTIDLLYNFYKNALRTKMKLFMSDVTMVQNKKGDKGVLLTLASRWKDDEAGGKRSYGYLRSLLIGAFKSKWMMISQSKFKRLRLEVAEGKNELVLYMGRKARTWQSGE